MPYRCSAHTEIEVSPKGKGCFKCDQERQSYRERKIRKRREARGELEDSVD